MKNFREFYFHLLGQIRLGNNISEIENVWWNIYFRNKLQNTEKQIIVSLKQLKTHSIRIPYKASLNWLKLMDIFCLKDI